MLLRSIVVACTVGFVHGFVVPSSSLTATKLNLESDIMSLCHSVQQHEEEEEDREQRGAMSRRQALFCTTAAAVSLLVGSPAVGVDEDAAVVRAAFDKVQKQVAEGVAYMQECIDRKDFAALMEYSKTYDQILRKGAMGTAKKMLEDKQTKELATTYCNSVTFDLIGINKNSRPGQENVEQASKYLQELKDDVQKFLDLEPKISRS